MRPDGKRVKDLPAIQAAIPYIMPQRYDAQNHVTQYADMEPLKKYIQKKRKEGIRLSYMELILAAYYKAALKHPRINRFIMNCKVYQRNHFCVSFVILKKRADGTPDETTLKIYFEEDDDIFSIHNKIEAAVEENRVAAHSNSTDKFANFMLSLPLLPRLVIGLAKLLDHFGLLPRFIIDLSPFHTSLFITNLASINTRAIYHHCYEFGTTGVFVALGKPEPDHINGRFDRKVLPLKVVMDERICTGHDYASFFFDMQRYLKNPELLENAAEEPENAEEAEEAEEALV